VARIVTAIFFLAPLQLCAFALKSVCLTKRIRLKKFPPLKSARSHAMKSTMLGNFSRQGVDARIAAPPLGLPLAALLPRRKQVFLSFQPTLPVGALGELRRDSRL
jgi:hypothetical protein